MKAARVRTKKKTGPALRLQEVKRGERVCVFEVGARDGLQNEQRAIPTESKLQFLVALAAAGIRELEVGAFVRPDRVPQMADTAAVYDAIRGGLPIGKATPWCLVPNRKGLERALVAGVRSIAVFTAASDGFAKSNIGMTVRESLAEIAQVIALAKASRIRVRGYVSTAFGCPFDGKVPARQALRVVDRLLALGVEEVSVGDTIGVATPGDLASVIGPALKNAGVDAVAMHFHDTRGTALANALRSLELGVRRFDSSAGGLGGCPFAPGATGNLATEDLLYLLHGLGLKTGIDLGKVSDASLGLAARMQRPLTSRYLAAYAAKRSPSFLA